jgi:hypothetical protein
LTLVDGRHGPARRRVVDVTKPLTFPNQSVDVICLEEVIEHISQTRAAVTTPCLDLFAAQFDGSTAYEKRVNDIFYQHGHRHIYSKAGVRALLEAAGLAAVTESSFRDGASAHGYFDTHALRLAISDRTTTQYWNAVKSG